MEHFNINLSELIEIYNYRPHVLSRKAIKVSLTEDDIIIQNNPQIFLETTRNGNYWVIVTEDSNYWLLPKANLKIDIFKYETLKLLFNCDEYQPETAKKFSLIQPAQVDPTPDSLKWKLEKPGKLEFLNFSKTSELSKLQAEIECLNEENNKLQFQLEQLSQEPYQLQSQFKQLTEQIQSQKQEFNKQIQQAAQETHSLLNRMQMQFSTQLNKLETELKDIKIYLTSNQQKKLPPVNKDFQISTTPTQEVSFNQADGSPQLSWLSAYNHNPDSFSELALEVSETEESMIQRRLGNNQPVVIEKVRKGRGKYWILILSQQNYLVPKSDLKINPFNLSRVQVLFQCIDYLPEKSHAFTLIKPAVVFLNESGKWQLQELGVLKF
ncbi:hypothetical protein NIES2100_61780 [Calothrix sp. NIES-2100]|uniref:coiled-coil domain-containing protein n=1 Tax=Calothrix sp. NIES-2100 TaxID=1954172 RepID=UPI000B5E748D|nr:hypothetical protein NIES2100_61780 [Calothrix sp. NIES-2100]